LVNSEGRTVGSATVDEDAIREREHFTTVQFSSQDLITTK